jgi:PIN domain nuclease of toxin-antitoxin system
LQAQGFEPLSVHWSHELRAGSYALPHRDPLDRLLAAQAELEAFTHGDLGFGLHGISFSIVARA